MAAALAWVSPFAQLVLIAAGGVAGLALLRDRRHVEEAGHDTSSAASSATATPATATPATATRTPSWRMGVVALALFLVLLVVLPLAGGWGVRSLAMADAFYSSGALVFGGGHVVLPLLHANVVDPGWVSDSAFVAGYGAAQALPGPLFAFAGFLGTISNVTPSGVPGGILAIVAIFLPGFLLVLAAMPVWDRLRASPRFRRALLGVNAVVVGLLAAALYTPVWTTAIVGPADVVVAGAGFLMLLSRRVPPIAVVGFAAAAGQVVVALGVGAAPIG
jgi:chromate transporter